MFFFIRAPVRNMKSLNKNALKALLFVSATNVNGHVAMMQVESVRWKFDVVLHSVSFVGQYACMCKGNNATRIFHWQLHQQRALVWRSWLLHTDTVIQAVAGTRTATLGGFHISTTWQVCVCAVKSIHCYVFFWSQTYAWNEIFIYILFPELCLTKS